MVQNSNIRFIKNKVFRKTAKGMNKILSVLLVIAIFFSIALPANAARAADFIDIPDNWSKTAILEAISNNLLTGSGNKIMPDAELKRCEMAAIINRAFGASQKGDIRKFIDIPDGKWYVDDMAKAVKMGVFKGDGNLMHPENHITRQEAFVVLARALKLTSNEYSSLDKFTDKNQVSEWAKPGTAALVNAGYVSGSKDRLNPQASITRAEFAQLMYNIIRTYIKASGTYTTVAEGNVMVNVPEVTLKGVNIKGDLIIGDGVGKGSVTLDTVNIDGRLIVRGGGNNSIHIINGSKINGTVIIDNQNNEVRLVTDKGTTVKKVEAGSHIIFEGNFNEIKVIGDTSEISDTDNNLNIEIKGQIQNLTVESPAKIALKGGVISNITVSNTSMESEVIINGATVANLNIFARTEVIVNSGSVESIKTGIFAKESIVTVMEGAKVQAVNAQIATTITGNGTVASVAANANNVRVDTLGTVVTVSKGVSGVIAGGNPVGSGLTITTALNDPSIDKGVDNDDNNNENNSNIHNKSNKGNNGVPSGGTPGGGTPGGGTPGGGTGGGGGSPDGGGNPGGDNGGNNGGSDPAKEQANQAIATAKGLVPATFTADEETDTDLITSLNNISGMAATGVTLSISNTSNNQVAADGKITYGDFQVTGDVTISISKAKGTAATKTIFVTVPATQAIPDNERIISGTISLPNGEVAPEGGKSVNIRAWARIDTNKTINVSKDIIISEGQNSVKYSLQVPVNTVGSGYEISYSTNLEYGYVRYGYYSTEGTTYRIALATFVDVSNGNRENINLEVIPGKIISGIISLPEGKTAPTGGMQIRVNLENDNGTPDDFMDDINFLEYINIPEGQNSISYSVPVVANISYAKYVVSYSINSEYGYVQHGYYSTKGTTPSRRASSLVDVSDGSRSDINLNILEANLISGIISLPDGDTAPKGGMEIFIVANYRSNIPDNPNDILGSVNAKIPEGENSVSYSIPVPANSPGSGYRVEYHFVLTKYSGYWERAYYSTKGTTSQYNEATLVDVSEGNKDSINLEILNARIISGTISLPDGHAAPEGGIQGIIWVTISNNQVPIIGVMYPTRINIPEGQNQADYSLNAPPNHLAENGYYSKYRVMYTLDPNYGYFSEGWYSVDGTKPIRSMSTPFDVNNEDVEGINLDVLPGKVISGKVSLPDGEIASDKGIDVTITARNYKDNSSDYSFSTKVSIPKGQNSQEYSIPVYTGDNRTVYYVEYYMASDLGYLQRGYYSKSGTTLIFGSSTAIQTSSNNISDIDIKILPANLDELRQEISVSINHAIFLKNYVKVGDGDGQVPQFEVDNFKAAIGAAQSVVDREDATAQEIADATTELYIAINSFVWEMRTKGYGPLIPIEVTESDNFDQVFVFLSIDPFEMRGEIVKENITFEGDLAGLEVVSVTRINSFNLLFRVTGKLVKEHDWGTVSIMYSEGGRMEMDIYIRAKEEVEDDFEKNVITNAETEVSSGEQPYDESEDNNEIELQDQSSDDDEIDDEMSNEIGNEDSNVADNQ